MMTIPGIQTANQGDSPAAPRPLSETLTGDRQAAALAGFFEIMERRASTTRRRGAFSALA